MMLNFEHMDDKFYMKRCLQLAALGKAYVAPNPMVGAVLVHEGRVIGEGFHRKYGEAHAEVNCIESVLPEDAEFISSSTLYVSLEPCSHQGKTGPCTSFIIKHKIPRVIIGCLDSYEKVNGTGVELLKEAGIEVISGILQDEARELNKRFYTFHEKQRPYIILKWAQTASGFIGEKDKSIQISNNQTNILVHTWRAEEAAIMVGTNTALADNPSLTVRHVPGKNPLRLVIDKNLKIPADFHLLDKQSPTIVINTIKNEEDGDLLFYKISSEENIVAVVISLLHMRNITSLIIEGGSMLIESFIAEGMWDEARVITSSTKNINDGIPAPRLSFASLVKTKNIDTDQVQFFKNNREIFAGI
ncbi:MAG: bifunctional diaminohydroxyphosphoribosylaminopyrimidine deaminase/5-amino-6-(5-phosphoribosylamino)uracil reductase RibD [Ferruginibacter sp.]